MILIQLMDDAGGEVDVDRLPDEVAFMAALVTIHNTPSYDGHCNRDGTDTVLTLQLNEKAP